jgi:phosphoglycolate phosphatase
MRIKKKLLVIITCIFFFFPCNSDGIKHIIIDFSGVLRPLQTLFNSYAQEFGYTAEEFGSITNKGMVEFLTKDLGVTKRQIGLKAVTLWRMATNHIIETPMHEDVKDVLHKLHRKGYGISILTSIKRETVLTILQREGLTGIVEYAPAGNLVDSFLFRHVKIRQLLRKKKLQPHQVLYIGDEASHMKIYQRKISRKEEFPTCAATWGMNSKETLSKIEPTFIIDSPEELLRILPPLEV